MNFDILEILYNNLYEITYIIIIFNIIFGMLLLLFGYKLQKIFSGLIIGITLATLGGTLLATMTTSDLLGIIGAIALFVGSFIIGYNCYKVFCISLITILTFAAANFASFSTTVSIIIAIGICILFIKIFEPIIIIFTTYIGAFSLVNGLFDLNNVKNLEHYAQKFLDTFISILRNPIEVIFSQDNFNMLNNLLPVDHLIIIIILMLIGCAIQLKTAQKPLKNFFKD
ncbi:hypothetical protein AN641_01475 [Candidatus Epulonipiscioides gigas]|nr:hypothetical protein AN641_01475 [Epulopiscium sp. SCG-C07WGA-EpuloA2]